MARKTRQDPSRVSARISSRIPWDDLRFVLAVAAQGSLAGAARALGVNHTTVLRRVNAFEERLGLRLFERLATGYVLTAGGGELIEAARQMEDTVLALERRLAGQDRTLSGAVRVTTTDTLANSILPDVLAAFRTKYPRIVIELDASNAVVSLARRAADVAIRPADRPPEALVGRRISAIGFAIYAGTCYLAERGGTHEISTQALADHIWIGPDDSLADTSVGRWMRAALPQAEVALRASSLLALRQAAAAGLGLAALPCYLAEGAPNLVRVHPPIPAMATALWVVTHADLRRAARIRAFTDFVSAALARHRALLEGSVPQQRG
jgi:DNA-binding transcriptional LysR family regulator